MALRLGWSDQAAVQKQRHGLLLQARRRQQNYPDPITAAAMPTEATSHPHPKMTNGRNLTRCPDYHTTPKRRQPQPSTKRKTRFPCQTTTRSIKDHQGTFRHQPDTERVAVPCRAANAKGAARSGNTCWAQGRSISVKTANSPICEFRKGARRGSAPLLAPDRVAQSARSRVHSSAPAAANDTRCASRRAELRLHTSGRYPCGEKDLATRRRTEPRSKRAPAQDVRLNTHQAPKSKVRNNTYAYASSCDAFFLYSSPKFIVAMAIVAIAGRPM